jgi:hypothetical protein
MGALVFLEALSVGQSLELSTHNGERAMATGVAAAGASGFTPPAGAEGDLLVFHAGVWQTVIAPDVAGTVLTSQGLATVPAFAIIQIPAPPAIIVANANVSSAKPWVTFQAVTGGFTLTLTTVPPGVLFRMQWVAGGTSTLSVDAVTLSRGANTFTIENPQDRSLATANSVLFETDNMSYEYMLDATANVLRCMSQVR